MTNQTDQTQLSIILFDQTELSIKLTDQSELSIVITDQSQALADNIDVEEAKSRAEAAKQAALSALEISQNEALAHQQRQQSQQSQHELEDDDEEEENNIMLGIEIIKQKEGETSGTYRCA